MADREDSFVTRWSRRKAQARQAEAAPVAPVAPVAPPSAALPDPTVPAALQAMPELPAVADPAREAPQSLAPALPIQPASAQPPLPSLADVAALTRSSDYSRFVAREVAPDVRNAALRQLFTDPHFNVMDGLDIYIDDYGKPDPLPAGMLRKMVQSQLLGLFDDEPDPATASPIATESAPPAIEPPEAAAPVAAPPLAPPELPTHEDPDLQLQPDDVPGCSGPEPCAEPDPGRQH